MQYNNVFAFFALKTNAGAENTLRNKTEILTQSQGIALGGWMVADHSEMMHPFVKLYQIAEWFCRGPGPSQTYTLQLARQAAERTIGSPWTALLCLKHVICLQLPPPINAFFIWSDHRHLQHGSGIEDGWNQHRVSNIHQKQRGL